jgi:hypothetical protein
VNQKRFAGGGINAGWRDKNTKKDREKGKNMGQADFSPADILQIQKKPRTMSQGLGKRKRRRVLTA